MSQMLAKRPTAILDGFMSVSHVVAGIMVVGLALSGIGCDSAGSENERGDAEAPMAPSGLDVSPVDGRAVLSWEAVSGASGYNVYRATEPMSGATGDPLASVSKVRYLDEDVQSGITYYYRVTAIGGGGSESDASEEVAVARPAAPSNLSAESQDNEVGLTWEGAEKADTYKVYRSTSPTEDVSGDPLVSGVEGTRYTDGRAQNGTTYYYRVTGVSAKDAESNPSDKVEVTPFSGPPNRPQ